MDINWALLVTNICAIIIQIGLPVALAIWLIRKYQSSWIMIVTGLLTYTIALLINIPALNGIKALFANGTLSTPESALIPYVNAGIVGFLTAIIQEGLRWIGFRLNEKYAKPFRSAMGLGIGHGGAEILIIGGLVAYNLFSVLFYNPGHQIANGVSIATVQSVLAQNAAYWQTSWINTVLSVFESLVQFSAQLVFSYAIWKAVTRQAPIWFLAAIIYHTVVAGMTTFLYGLNWGTWQIEGVLALILLLDILLLYYFWGDEGGLDSEGDEYDDDDDDNDEEDGIEDEEEEDEVEPKSSAHRIKRAKTE